MERRKFIKGITAATITAPFIPQLLGSRLYAEDEDEIPEELPYEELYKDIVGDAEIKDGQSVMELNIPKQPSSGAAVPIEVTVNLPMEKDNFVTAIYVLTTKNKINHVITANYTPDNGIAYLFVNAKLATKQDVVIIAETNNGEFYKASQYVRAPLGGCG
jgi:sulfur-oxidizing protein SoxY